MALPIGKVCGEKWKHGQAMFGYQPTGTGDFYRWRWIVTRLTNNTAHDNTYYAIAGVSRGRCYAGSSKLFSESDANSGFTDVGTPTYYGMDIVASSTTTHYRTFNKPDGMTHARVWGPSSGVTTRGVKVEFLNASDEVLGVTVLDQGSTAGAGIKHTGWLSVPTGSAKLKCSPNNAATVYLSGVDWINLNSVVSPDTEGSQMFDGEAVTAIGEGNISGVAGNVKPVILYDAWNGTMDDSAIEFALFWENSGDPFTTNGNNSAGGVAHRGIDTATCNWYTQSGTDSPVLWETPSGKTAVVDYFYLDIPSAKVYRESARTNYRGDLVSRSILSGEGLMIDNRITAVSDMDVFQFFTGMGRTPAGTNRVLFGGDDTIRTIPNDTLRSTIKTSSMTVWGDNSDTAITAECFNTDSDQNFYQNVASLSYPRVYGSTTSKKIYFNRIESTDTPLALATGSTIGNRFKLVLRDKSLGVPVAIVPESYYGRQLRNRSNEKPF